MTDNLTTTPAWQELHAHWQQLHSSSIVSMFSEHPQRAEQLSLQAAGLLLDYSKNLITNHTIDLLIKLAQQQQLTSHIYDLFAGNKVNTTENNSARHTALRAASDKNSTDNQEINHEIKQELAKMRTIVESLHNNTWLSYTSEPITDVVAIGIGGSHLGNAMVIRALPTYCTNKIRTHFVANIDGHEISQVLKSLNPNTTLFICASKTFTTGETITNLQTANKWLTEKLGTPAAITKQLIAITANPKRAIEQAGIAPNNILTCWDWLGGRYSLWSAMGLPIAIAIGFDNFQALLLGAQQLDEHFQNAPMHRNMPVIMGLLSIWHHNFFNAQSHAVIPYAQDLELLVPYLQQLAMESNGKSITRNGELTTTTTGPILWGGVGSNGQHSFHQLLHQGTHFIPVDFILPLTAHHQLPTHHQLLVSHCLAQAQSLLLGEHSAQPHKILPGNNPSNMIMFNRLTPQALGSLIALYEHKTFVQAMIWEINPFDQWGVELGKQFADHIYDAIVTKQLGDKLDPSTKSLLQFYFTAQQNESVLK